MIGGLLKMSEINLLEEYPKLNRDTKTRADNRTEEIIKLAKKFNWEYFDKKGICYGGYYYDGRWIPIADKFIKHYKLKPGNKILDIGSAKGYLVYDLRNKGMDAYGLEISEYAIDCAPSQIQRYMIYGNAKHMPMFKDREFDLVISINTIHNLPEKDCRDSLREIQRIGKNSFITVDSYRTAEEKKRMFEWNLTAETVKSTEDWKIMFDEEGYKGDFYWFIP